jgi:predicted kinase
MPAHPGGARLVIVCGLPGAGKTTLARKLERQPRAIRHCPDEWMEQLSIDLWEEAKRAGATRQ